MVVWTTNQLLWTIYPVHCVKKIHYWVNFQTFVRHPSLTEPPHCCCYSKNYSHYLTLSRVFLCGLDDFVSCFFVLELDWSWLLLLRMMVIILIAPVSDAVADYESLATAHVLLAHCCELNLRGNSLEIDSQKSWDVFYVPLIVSGSRLFMIFNLKGVLSFPLSRASSQAIQLWCSENLWSGVLIHQISLMFHSVFL